MKVWFHVRFLQHLNIPAGLGKITLPFIVWNMFPGEREYVLVFIIEHIFMFKLQRKWEESIKQEASVFFTGRASGIWCDFNIFHCLIFTDGSNSKVLCIRKWVETGKEILQREEGRKDRRQEGSGAGRKLEDYKNPQVLLTYHWRKKGEGQSRERQEEGKMEEEEEEGRRERLQNCTDFPQYGLELGLWFRASQSIGWPKKSFWVYP